MVENVQHTGKESKASYLKGGFFRKKPRLLPADVPQLLLTFRTPHWRLSPHPSWRPCCLTCWDSSSLWVQCRRRRTNSRKTPPFLRIKPRNTRQHPSLLSTQPAAHLPPNDINLYNQSIFVNKKIFFLTFWNKMWGIIHGGKCPARA